MEKRQWILATIALVLIGVYIYFFTDWFKPKTIHIADTQRPLRSRFLPGITVNVAFAFERPYRLTEVKVVPLAEWQTNQLVLPVWHLISDSKSEPVRFFFYGQIIRGMKTAMPDAQPEPLQTNILYRLFVFAGSVKGQHDFEIGKRPSLTSTNQ
jgi:hypothetical protein